MKSDSSLDLSDLLKPHVGLLLWILFIGFGGGVLALYYADIHYFPEITWQASLTFLGVISIVGGMIVVILSLLLFFPGFIWCRFLVCDKLLDEHVFQMRGERLGESCIFQITTRLGIPFLLLIGLAHVLLRLGLQGVGFFVGALVLLLLFFWYIWRLFLTELWGEKSFRSEGLHSRLRNPSFWFNVVQRNEMISLRFLKSSFLFGLPESRKRQHDAKEDKAIDPADPSTSRLFKYAFWFDVSVIISFAALYLIYEISKTEEGAAFVLLALICTAIVFLSNCAVAVLYRKYPARAIAVSIIAATLLLFAADSSNSLTTNLMASYGFGGGQEVTIVVDQKGCLILKRLDLLSSSDFCERGKYARLREVQLLSRLGSEYFFRSRKKDFVLPRESVVSWSIERSP